MRTQAIAGAAATALLAGWMATAQAGTVTFSADQTTVGIGATVTFTYTMDFSDDPTYGGGTDIWYDDTVLQFVGWSFAPASGSDRNTFYDRAPTDCSAANSDAGCSFDANEFAGAQLNGLAWGNDAGMGGPEVIGTMVFTAIGLGVTDIFMASNDDGQAENPGPFVSTTTFMPENTLYNADSVTVVPVPAAVWLMISGLGFLGGLRRFG